MVSGPASAAPYDGAETEVAVTPSYQTMTTERIGLVQRITLNRPEKRNALSLQLQNELIHAVREAETSNGRARCEVRLRESITWTTT